MVVDPTVVEKVESPEVTTETISDVVTAEEDPDSVDPDPDPDPDPAPAPTAKIVVEPMVVVISEEPEVMTETMAEVVTADDEA